MSGIDATLTLTGLLGRSIVIHAESGGEGRVACADVVAGRANSCSATGTQECVVTSPNGFGCACKPGWGGADCSEDIDECCSSPCQRNQVCTDFIDGYECRTPASFSAGVEAVAVFIEDVACSNNVRTFSWLWVLLVLACLGSCIRQMCCGGVRHVADLDDALAMAFESKEDHTMWILFVIVSEQRHALEVMSNEWDIETVQQKVADATGVAVADQRLEFGGRLLRPGKKLTSYGVQHGSELVLRSAAGGEVVTRQGAQMTKRREIKAVKGKQRI
jgi:hypothetical protein